MIQRSKSKQASAFEGWLRTGRLPPVQSPDGVELKFNPWHDPDDGRFTFAGSGRRFSAGDTKPAAHATGHAPGAVNRDNLRNATIPTAATPPPGRPARYGNRPRQVETIEARPQPSWRSRLDKEVNSTVEFVGGVNEGLYDVAKGTVKGVVSALTTNPVTTARTIALATAGLVDAATAAENTPALTHIAHAADRLKHASAREIGHASGSIVGNVALTVAPGTAFSKVAALRRLRMARPRAIYDHPRIGWVKENLGKETAATRYNDAATGARPGMAPTLMRTMPDGSKRPVKFDGVQGEYLIDRKLGVVGRPRAVAQLKKQSEVLAQHNSIGIWEVPNQKEKIASIKLFRKYGISNIKIRIVKP